MALTDKAIVNAKPGLKPYKLSDEKGLFLLISPVQRNRPAKASKLWRFKYRFGGKEKLLALGSYPETPLAEARKRRDAARELAAHEERDDVRGAYNRAQYLLQRIEMMRWRGDHLTSLRRTFGPSTDRILR